MSTALRKAFTKKNDEKLISIIKSIGTSDWKKVAERMCIFTARQCKDRYNIYLKETNKQEPWSPEEDELLIKLQAEFGSKWTKISEFFEGRNINNIKNRWHRCIKFRVENEGLNKQKEISQPEPAVTADQIQNLNLPEIIDTLEFPENEYYMELAWL